MPWSHLEAGYVGNLGNEGSSQYLMHSEMGLGKVRIIISSNLIIQENCLMKRA